MSEPSEPGSAEAATPAAVQHTPDSSGPWGTLDPYFEPTTRPPGIVSGPDGRFHPCFLYRGSENWLTRLGESRDSKERMESVRQEVRAFSARWLKMQNVCVLAGAGASQYVGGFVGSGLFARVQELLRRRPSSSTLEDLLSQSSRPEEVGPRFEAFLTQLSFLSRLQANADWPLDKIAFDIPITHIRGYERRKAALRDLLQDIERAIAVECSLSLPASAFSDGEGETTAHEVFLSKLVARDPQAGRTRIFTVNYDTLFEQAMDRLGIIYWDGFSGTVDRRFNPAAYDLDIHYPGDVTEGKVRRFDKVLFLYKLHGSITWARVEPSANNLFGVVQRREPLPTRDQVLSAEGGPALLDGITSRLAILPTAAKYAESLSMPFAHVFRSLGESLNRPQTVLFVLGYSGWDLHINALVEDALSNPGFGLVIVDPSPSAWARRLCHADSCGRVYCFGGEWGKFEFFARHILPDLETFRTDLAVAKTLREIKRDRAPLSADAERTEPKDA